jgi:hypothetical protein
MCVASNIVEFYFYGNILLTPTSHTSVTIATKDVTPQTAHFNLSTFESHCLRHEVKFNNSLFQ